MTATKTQANGKYTGTFRWGREGDADVSVELSKNDHGWFCDSVNGQEWVYPAPLDPWGGWGAQIAKRTPLEAVRGFLRMWDSDLAEAEADTRISTAADTLRIERIED